MKPQKLGRFVPCFVDRWSLFQYTRTLQWLLAQYDAGDKIEKNEMGGVFSADWGRGEVYTGF
jgi:hypothetical protein